MWAKLLEWSENFPHKVNFGVFFGRSISVGATLWKGLSVKQLDPVVSSLWQFQNRFFFHFEISRHIASPYMSTRIPTSKQVPRLIDLSPHVLANFSWFVFWQARAYHTRHCEPWRGKDAIFQIKHGSGYIDESRSVRKWRVDVKIKEKTLHVIHANRKFISRGYIPIPAFDPFPNCLTALNVYLVPGSVKTSLVQIHFSHLAIDIIQCSRCCSQTFKQTETFLA